MFNSDKPIFKEDEDKLNRMPFVKRLSKSICNYGSQDCLVIGLMGEWGCGKTSILNLTFNEIKKERKEWILIDFDPWYFSNQDNLILQFFNRLLNELKFQDKLTQKAKETLLKFMKGISINVNLKFLSANLDLDKVLEQEEFEKFNSFKKDLINIFNDLDYKIIISIDNLDRLTDDEIKQIFLLVKSLADFPNVIYILSFDRNVIINSFENLKIFSGDVFLEKIIQVPILVPEVTHTRLEDLILNRFAQIFKMHPEIIEKYFNTGFYSLHKYILPFIKTIRDLNRYTNILKFYFNSFVDEINIPDFLLLLVLQVFEPDIYLEIKNNKDILIDYVNFYDLSRNEQKKLLDNLMNKLHDLSRNKLNEEIESILTFLFPIFKKHINLQYILENQYEKWYKSKSICVVDNFDKYFTLSLEDYEISQVEISNFLKFNDINKISDWFLNLNSTGQLRNAFDKLIDRTDEIPKENCQYFIKSIFYVADDFDFSKDLIISEYSYVYPFLINLIKLLEDEKELFDILENTLSNNYKLFTVIRFIYTIGYEYGFYISDKSKNENEMFISEDKFWKLKDMACQKIKILGEEGLLIKDKHLNSYLTYWRIWESKKEVYEFIDKTIQTNENLIIFLDNFRESSSANLIDFENIDNCYDLDNIIKRMNQIRIEGVNEKFVEQFFSEYTSYLRFKSIDFTELKFE